MNWKKKSFYFSIQTKLKIYDCHYKDDRCCWYCDKRFECKAKVKCEFDCFDDDNDNPDDVNAYWEE